MGLESGNFISDLIITNPESTDKRRQGDDHLRLLKTVLKNTFPNLNAAVNPTPTQLNYLVGVTSAIQTQLDAKLESSDIDLTPYALLAVAQQWTKNQYVAPIDHGNQSGTLIIDMQTSQTHIVRATDNLTISLSNLAEGMDLVLKVIQGADSPAAVVTLPSEMKFSYGQSPTLTQTLDAYDVISGRFLDGDLISGIINEAG